jgi:two-component system nitrate/nitrite response regulator NarL
VVVVDDHPVVLKGLSSCLKQVKHILIVGAATNGQQALQLVKELIPDLVILDIEMPIVDGLTVADIIAKENAGIKVLALSAYTNSGYVKRVVESGARGYILKQEPARAIINAIETIHAGGTWFSQNVIKPALSQLASGTLKNPGLSKISDREREVLIAIAEGFGTKAIASRLGLSVRTIETHRAQLRLKLKIHDIAGLTKFAVAEALVKLHKVTS